MRCDMVRVRRSGSALLLIAWLAGDFGMAWGDPNPPDTTPHDPVAAPRASPWIDRAPSEILERVVDPDHEQEGPAPDHKIAAVVTLGGFYAGFTTWTYFA